MKPVVVLYATREGHTQRVAEQVAMGLRTRGFDAAALNVGDADAPGDLGNYAAVVLAASVHAGRHEPEMTKYVKNHRTQLDSVPNAFLSVTLSEAGAERSDTTAEQRRKFADDVRRMTDRFIQETGWHPDHVVPVAGALKYSKYNFLVRLLMKRIARQAGGSTDTSRDHEYTDWGALDRFVGMFADDIASEAQGRRLPSRPTGRS